MAFKPYKTLVQPRHVRKADTDQNLVVVSLTEGEAVVAMYGDDDPFKSAGGMWLVPCGTENQLRQWSARLAFEMRAKGWDFEAEMVARAIIGHTKVAAVVGRWEVVAGDDSGVDEYV